MASWQLFMFLCVHDFCHELKTKKKTLTQFLCMTRQVMRHNILFSVPLSEFEGFCYDFINVKSVMARCHRRT